MLNPLIEKEIITQLDKLSLQEQMQVLNLAKTLAGTMPVGIPGKELLHLAGSISHEDAKLMLEAIEKGCRQLTLPGLKTRGFLNHRVHLN